MTDSDPVIRGEVYYEFTPVGNSVRIVAIDAVTGTEITMVGSNTVSRLHLQRLARRKLEKRMRDEMK